MRLFNDNASRYARSIGYLLILIWLPALAFAESTMGVATPLTTMTQYYRNELIVGASVFMLLLGSAITAAWNPPVDIEINERLTSAALKFALGLAGGFSAFLYVLEQHAKLTLLHPVWVFGVSFVTPVAIQVAFPIAIKRGSDMLGAWFNSRGGNE